MLTTLERAMANWRVSAIQHSSFFSPRVFIPVIAFSFFCSEPHTQRCRQLLQLIFTLLVTSLDLELGRAYRKHLTSGETKNP